MLSAALALCLYGWYFTRVPLQFRFVDSPMLTPATLGAFKYVPRAIGLIPAVGLGLAFVGAANASQNSATPEVGTTLRLWGGVYGATN